jgi:hypothetical protein
MSKTGKDVILEYCDTVKTHDIDHLQSCLDNERDIRNGKTKDLSGCPSSYGLDDFDGLCFEEEVKGYKAQCEQCNRCWAQALELEIKER